MKRALAFVFLCIMVEALPAQNQNFADQYFTQQQALVHELTTQTEVWRVDSTYCWNVDENGEEVESVREYNLQFSEETGQILQSVRQQKIEGVWLDNLRQNFVYSEENEQILIEKIDEAYLTGQGSWQNQTRISYTYDAAVEGYSEILAQNWENNLWANSARTVNTYDENHGKLIQSDTYVWENESWALDQVFYYSVNVNTLNTVAVLFQKRNNEGVLENLTRSFSEFDEANNEIIVNRDFYFEGEWAAVSRTENIWAANVKTQETNFTWNATNEIWTPSNRTEFIYNSAGDISLLTGSTYDTDQAVFVNNYRTTYSYDNDENLLEFSSDIWLNEAWTYNGRCQLYWSLYEVEYDPNAPSALSDDFILNDCRIANPLQLGGTFSCTDWQKEGRGVSEFFNVNGRLVAVLPVDSEDDISIPTNLEQGFYTLVLKDNRGVVWRKKVLVLE